MFSIQDLLKRHRIPGLQQSETRREVAHILSNILGLSIKVEEIEVKEGVLILKTKPVLKSAVLIRQNEVIEELRKKDIEIKAIR